MPAGCLHCYSMLKKAHGWIRRKIVWASKTVIRYQPAQRPNGTEGDQETSFQTLLKIIQEWKNNRYLMSDSGHIAATDSHNVENIVEYSLLQIAKNIKGESIDLVQLRNPCGHGVWEGD